MLNTLSRRMIGMGMNIMNRYSLLLIASILVLSTVPIRSVSAQEKIPNPDELIVATTDMPQSADPQWCYDHVSANILYNVYEPLIDYKGNTTGEFRPRLAVEWPGSDTPTGRIVPSPPDPSAPSYTEETWYFKIRSDVNFAIYDRSTGDVTYDSLSTEDVEYSIERGMVEARSGGPQFMTYKALLDCRSANLSDPTWMAKIDNAVQRNETHVWFNLIHPFNQFQTMLIQNGAYIVNKDWVVAHGGWDGEHTMESLRNYNDPAVSCLDSPEHVMCGTGPYMLDVWNDIEMWWSVVKNDDYWGGWPASGSEGFVSRVTTRVVEEWSTRKQTFFAGDCDICEVPTPHVPYEMWLNYPEKPEKYPPGIVCHPDLPMLQVNNILFNFNVSTTSPYLGEPPYTAGEIHEGGIPIDFFSDINVRKGIAYSFNYEEFISDVLHGESFHAPSPHMKGFAYWEYIWNGGTLPNGTYLPPVDKYHYNQSKAIQHFMKAWNGEVWEKGFTVSITYDTGNEERMVSAQMIKENVEALNPKFHINVLEVDWPAFVSGFFNDELTLYMLGFYADYPHPYNLIFAYQHSEGSYPSYQDYSNSTVDTLIERTVTETDAENELPMLWWKIAQMYYEDAPSILINQLIGKVWTREWVHGWYYNPMYVEQTIGYGMWKGWYTPPPPPPTVTTSTVYGTSLPISTAFTDPVREEPAAGFLVFVQKSADKETWTNIGAAITDENGFVNVTVIPPVGIYCYRLNFTGYKVPTPEFAPTGTVMLNPGCYEQLIENGTLPMVLLSEVGQSKEVTTRTLEDILTDALTSMATEDDVNSLSSELSGEISDLRNSVNSLTNYLYASILIAIIAIIVAIVAVIKRGQGSSTT
jgi:peptide/nickel transport system substrate-binding protein